MIRFSAELITAEGENYEIKSRNIKSIDADINSRREVDSPSFGIISNVADISLYNAYEEFIELLQNTSNIKKCKITLFLENTLGVKNSIVKYKAQSYWISNYSYDKFNQEIKISLTDNLTDMQNLELPEMIYYVQENCSAKDIATFLYSLTIQNGYEFLYNLSTDEGWDLLRINDNDTYFALVNTKIKRFAFEKASLWNFWQQLCELCGLNIFMKNGYIIIKRGL